MLGTRTHVGGVGLSRKATNASIALLLALLALIFFFLYVALTAQAAQGQTAVPRTARQAATMPKFAAKLRAAAAQNGSKIEHRYHLQGGYRNPLRSRQGGSLPTDDVVYTNGPINGTTDAWTINLGFIVSDTFTVPNGGANLSALTFGAWLFPGDVLQSVEVSITDSEFGGTTYFDGIVNFSQSDCIGNQYGFNVCTESGNFTLNNLAEGTYWVNLQNASVNTGDPVYWDENSGPSLASENSVGTIPSEAFTLLGSATTSTCYPRCEHPPECVRDKPDQGFRILHNFAGNEQSPQAGLAVDASANLYGTTVGGAHGSGLAYEVSASGIFFPLYSFLGGVNGQNPLPEVIGPEKALYGTADGGIQNCGSSGTEYCGVVYRLRPSPVVCLAALCSWTEDIIYRFAGNTDGWRPNGNLVFDTMGHLYGTTERGGAYGQGAIFELTPSNHGWSERVIYSFTGGSDGGQPDQLLVSPDGNLRGRTYSGGAGSGVIFELLRDGGGWTEQVITNWHHAGGHLRQDSFGDLYGLADEYIYQCFYWGCFNNLYTKVVKMFRLPDGWHFLDEGHSEDWGGLLPAEGYQVFTDFLIDPQGGPPTPLYAIVDRHVCDSGVCEDRGAVVGKEGRGVGFYGHNFRDLAVANDGKLYGTTGACQNSLGTLWQLTSAQQSDPQPGP
jgi:uncharacterized repeat protein (TIGR03803 family)